MAEKLTNSIKSRKCFHVISKPNFTSYVARLIKINYDELVSFHSISHLSVVSSIPKKMSNVCLCVSSSCSFPVSNHGKIGGIVISDKSDLTKIMSP